MSFVERIKLTDGTEVASVNVSNQLEVAEANSAAIKTAVETIDNAISGNEMQVDVVAALPAGTNNIGDVDVLTVPAPLSTSGNGTAASALRVTVASDSTGTIAATQSGTWNINNISGTISLPTNAATSGNQSTMITALQLLDDVVVTDNAGFTDGTTKLAMAGYIYDEFAGTALTENDAAAGRINANRAVVNALEDGATRGRYATVTVANALKVDGSAVTQPVSGTFWQATQPVSNAGTFAVQASQSGTWSVRAQDGAGNNLTSAARGSERALSVQIVDASGNQVTSFGGGSGGGTQYTEDNASAGGESLTLAGAIRQDTPASSTTADGDYSNLKTDSVGRLWVNASGATVPVSGTFWQATQPVSGTVTANAGTGNFASNITQYGGSAVGASNALHVQPGTGASFTVAQATASNLNATVLNQYTRNGAATTALLDTTTATNNRPFPVLALSADGAAPFDTNSGAAAATTLRTVLSTRHEAAATPLSLRLSDGTNFIATLPVSLASVPSHPVTNAGTFAVQAAQSGTWNITNVSGTVSLPTGASTSANQSTIITALQLLDDVVATDGSAALTKLYQVGGTDGTNAQILSTNASGHLNIADGGNIITVDGTVSITANSSVNMAQIGGTNTVNGGTAGTIAVGGIQAHDTPISGNNPILCGSYYAVTPADVASGDVTRTWASPKGALLTGAKYEASPPSFFGDTVYHLTLAQDGRLRVDFDFTGKTIATGGNIAHDITDTGNPIKIGAKAIAHGTNPTAVGDADRTNLYANRHGILWTIGGHPNLQSAEYITTAAQTSGGDNVLPLISAGTRYVITGVTVTASAANTVNTSVRLGFGTTGVPTQGASAADAVTKVILSHPGIAPGSGVSKGHAGGIVGIGGDGEELYIVCSVPTGGSLVVQVDYYTIES